MPWIVRTDKKRSAFGVVKPSFAATNIGGNLSAAPIHPITGRKQPLSGTTSGYSISDVGNNRHKVSSSDVGVNTKIHDHIVDIPIECIKRREIDCPCWRDTCFIDTVGA